MTLGPRRLSLSIFAGLTLLSAGCSSSPDRDDYLRRGDAICTRTAAEHIKLTSPRKGDLRETARYLRSSADLVDGELTQLRKLSHPAGDGERLGDLLDREGDAIATVRKAADAADRGAKQSAEDLFTQGQGELSDVGAGLRDYGFTVCGT